MLFTVIADPYDAYRVSLPWVWRRRQEPQVGQQRIVRNSGRAPMVVRIEPWADEAVIQPGADLHLCLSGPPGHAIEVENAVDALVVYGWTGSTYEVSRTTT